MPIAPLASLIALKSRFKCIVAPKSFNNNIGLPLTLLSAEACHQVIITELGSNRPGDISYLAKIAQGDIVLITNIHPAHLAGFGSIKEILKEKACIAQGLKPGGKILINGDFQDLVDHCAALGLDFATFGESSGCNIRPTSIISKGSCGELTIEGVTISVPLPGRANLANTLAAWAVCKQFALSPADFAAAIKKLNPVNMRLEIQTIGPIPVINDCYNANPASMANALDCLSQTAAAQGARPVFICGEMAELGEQSSSLHGQLAINIATAGVQLLLATGPFAQTIASAARKNTDNNIETAVFESTETLCDNLQDFILPDDLADTVATTFKEHSIVRHLYNRFDGWSIFHRGKYQPVEDVKEIRLHIRKFLSRCRVKQKKKSIRLKKQTSGFVTDVVESLASLKGVHLLPSNKAPCSLDKSLDPQYIIAANNVLVDISKRPHTTHPITEKFYTLNYLNYDYIKDAFSNKFAKFLVEITKSDVELMILLQQWCGYLLLPTLKYQKFLLCVGDGANGKGVFFDIVTAALGLQNVSNVPLVRFESTAAIFGTHHQMANMTNESLR